ncbi:MAG: phosphotransacetylase family protein [Candidatus Bathyarchaeia archaeon]
MVNLYVTGYGFSGKTAICLGLASKFKEKGLEVGYFKPIGTIMTYTEGKPVDEDVVLMKKLLDLKPPVKDLCPLTLPDSFLDAMAQFSPDELLSRIKKAYESASGDKDIVIFESSADPERFFSFGLSTPELAGEFEAPVLFVAKGGVDSAVDKILLCDLLCKKFGSSFLGFVLNNVPLTYLEKAKGIISPLLEKKGLRSFGIVPEDVRLTAPTVSEIIDVLGGQVLEGATLTDRLVENLMVGAMAPESALSFFRRSTDKAVITAGDRADVALAALETSTSVLILTDNLYPDKQVLRRAAEKGVPVILVPYDTYTTTEKLEALTGRIKPSDAKKIELAGRAVARHVKWRSILKELGLLRSTSR